MGRWEIFSSKALSSSLVVKVSSTYLKMAESRISLLAFKLVWMLVSMRCLMAFRSFGVSGMESLEHKWVWNTILLEWGAEPLPE